MNFSKMKTKSEENVNMLSLSKILFSIAETILRIFFSVLWQEKNVMKVTVGSIF